MIFFISQSIFICHSPHFSIRASVLKLSQCLRIRCHDYCSFFKGTLNHPFSLIFISDYFLYHFIYLLTLWGILFVCLFASAEAVVLVDTGLLLINARASAVGGGGGTMMPGFLAIFNKERLECMSTCSLLKRLSPFLSSRFCWLSTQQRTA
jgi:hypothetical protein